MAKMTYVDTLAMGKRIFNSKMLEEKDENGTIKYSDDEAIKALCSTIFAKNGTIKNMERLRSFNALIVQVAEEEVKADYNQIINAVANYEQIGRYDNKVYKIPKKARIHTALSASGSGVDFVRITAGQKTKQAMAKQHQFGCKYNIERMISDPVNEFRNAVNYVAQHKIKYTFEQIMMLARTGVSLGKIPSGQEVDGANTTMTDFKSLESKLLRYGSNVSPVLIADRLMIDDLADKQSVMTIGSDKYSLLTDKLKESLLRDLTFSNISRSVAITIDNPFIEDGTNSKTEFDVTEGLLLAGGNKSPFYITEFGSMRTIEGMPDIENEEVNMKIDFKVDITLLRGEALGYIHDTALKA